MDARALWITGPGRTALRTERLAAPGPDEVRVRAMYSGVSRGTEALVLSGGVPKSQHSAMRAPFQQGDFPWPVKYGYASVGRVEVGPDSGRVVFCLFPHQDAYVVPSDAVIDLPAGLPPARAVLAANLETAVNAVWDTDQGPGDRVAVVGAGVVGSLTAWLLGHNAGASVQLVDLHDRTRLAEILGVVYRQPEQAAADCDLAIEASGTAEGLSTALRLAGDEATVLCLSWFGDTSVSLPLGEAFHSRRLVLRSSQVGRVATSRRSRWTPRRRLALALDLLGRAPELDALIDSEGSFAELPDDLCRVAASPGQVLCHRVVYGE